MDHKTDLKEIILGYLKYWKWFVLTTILAICLAFVYLRYAKVQYLATAKVQILEEDGKGGLDLFNDLDLFSISKNNVLDEMEIIKSHSHLLELTKRLKLNTQIFNVGNVLESEIYHAPPLNITFVEADTTINKSSFYFYLVFKSSTNFEYFEEKDSTKKTYSFGKNIDTPIGEIVLTPDLNQLNKFKDKTLKVSITPVDLVSSYLKETILIELNDDKSNILNLSLRNGSPKKARDILNELIKIYNENAVLDKQIIADKTSQFIDDRISDISNNLSSVDQSAENLRTSRGIADLASETNINLNVGASNRQDLSNAQNQYAIASSMNDMVERQDGFEVLPSNIGLSDPSIASTTSKYNELVQERNRLLKSGNERNPIIVELDETIRGLKKNLQSSLQSTVNNLGMTVNTLSNQQAIINSRIYAAPKNERALRDITRRQQTTESLYLYLLQKREEAQIAAVSTTPKCKIVDFATSEDSPVAPRRKVTLLASIIFGLLIPFSIIYVADLLDTKVKNMKTLNQIVTDNIPVLGELPKVSKKQLKRILVDDRSILGESLRIIRTNLDYLIKSGKSETNKNNVIYVTSSVSGEGKTFVSSNLSMILASTKKKVLLIGADIRNPKINDFFTGTNIDQIQKTVNPGSNGLTEYIIEKNLTIKDLVNTLLVENNVVDVIYSGKIPPNPAELLLNERVQQLIEIASDKYDYVIVDTAPLMLVTDTLLLAPYSNHIVYVTRSKITEKKAIEYPLRLQVEEKIDGLTFVVNDVESSDLGYGGVYGYGYGQVVKKWWKIW